MKSTTKPQVPKDVLARYPRMARDVRSSSLFLAPHQCSINGLNVEGLTNSGVFVCKKKRLHLYGVQKAFLGPLSQSEYAICGLDDLRCHFSFDGRSPVLLMHVTLKNESWFEANVALGDLEQIKILRTKFPSFPKRMSLDCVDYEMRVRKTWVSRQSLDAAPSEFGSYKPSIVGQKNNGYVIRSWMDDGQVQAFEVNDDDYFGFSEESGKPTAGWWDAGKSTWVTVGFQDEDTKLPRAKHPQVTDFQRPPLVARIRGLIGGENLSDATALIFNKQDGIFVYISRKKSFFCNLDIHSHFIDDDLILVDAAEDTCFVLDHDLLDGKSIARRLNLNIAEPEEPSDILGMIEYSDSRAGFDGPVYLNFQDRIVSRVAVTPVDLGFTEMRREKPGVYVAGSASDTFRLRFDLRDESRVREFVLHGSVMAQISDGTGARKLYHVLNGLRVRRFMSLLYASHGDLFVEIQKSPSPNELLASGFSREKNNDENLKHLLEKILLLAQKLPELKRSLEVLGAEYPHCINTLDVTWLKRAFGEQVGNGWARQSGLNHVSQLRAFVRSTQSTLWRSLSEIERVLVRLEPVYAEQLKAARNTARKQKYIVSTATSAMTVGLGFYNPMSFYVAGISLVNMINSVISDIKSNAQHKAMLMELGPEVLKWWSVFEKTFSFQVFESKAYLDGYFLQLAQRDAGLFKQMQNSNDTDLHAILKKALIEQIEQESQQRLESLGGNLIQEDMAETIESVHDKGRDLVTGCSTLK